MIIIEDFDIKLRKALAIHYGSNKVYVYKIRTEDYGTYYRINIKINDKYEWNYYLDESYLLALRISFDDLVKGIIDKFEEDKRGDIDDK